ncbi:MAG: hypothetical protein HPY57_14710 [Ignavibacteria bacterium]|nr:hypothetical protein [Ignavibacteria bacterium]
MNILIEGYKIECFENEKDYKLWIKDHQKETQIFQSCVYHGELYGITQEVKDLFQDNIIVSIKKKNYNDVQYILIHK